METTPASAPLSTKVLWTSRIMSALPVLLLLFSGTMKLVKPPGLAEGIAHLGLPANLVLGLGILELTCTVIYLIPRTAVLGAILLTGYLGGAMLTHLRIGEPCYVQFLLGVLIWGGLYLRDRRVRALIPFRQ
jgi:hypothetical protein